MFKKLGKNIKGFARAAIDPTALVRGKTGGMFSPLNVAFGGVPHLLFRARRDFLKLRTAFDRMRHPEASSAKMHSSNVGSTGFRRYI